MRELDGTLREGHWEERDRINFLFFQREGQSYKMPSVLEDEHLEVCSEEDSFNVLVKLSRGQHECLT